jgi:diacylglycerol kinase
MGRIQTRLWRHERYSLRGINNQVFSRRDVRNARVSWGVGVVVAILLSVAVYSFGLIDLYYTISLGLLLVGLWTIVCAFFLVDRKDQWYYSGWGVVLAFLSSFAYLPHGYTIGLVLIAIVALILLYVYVGGTSKMITAASVPTSTAGGTPAATAI